MTSRRATIVFNPAAGRSRARAEAVRAMLRRLADRGVEADAMATAAPGDATRLARDAVARGADVVVACGGDGTLNEVVQGVAGTGARLAVWAGGTANVVARDLALPRDAEAVAAMIAAGRSRRVALGLAIPEARPAQSRWFVMFAGIGLDAAICRAVDPTLKRRTGQLAFWIAGARQLARRPAPSFIIEVDGVARESVFAVVGKGKSYGGRLVFTPGARLEDDSFEVFMAAPRASRLGYVRDLVHCRRGRPERADATIVRGRDVRASSTHETWVELDGEAFAPLPVRFEARRDALAILTP